MASDILSDDEDNFDGSKESIIDFEDGIFEVVREIS